jgi:hypothetical protein
MKKLHTLVKPILIQNKNASYLHNDNTMTKYIDDEFINKPCVIRKNGSYDWIENVKTEDIDTKCFNLDYTIKL